MRVAHLKDETILRFYESIRTQVDAEHILPLNFMTGDSVKHLSVSVLISDLSQNDMEGGASNPELRNSPLEASSQPHGCDPDGESRSVVGLQSDGAHRGFA